MLVYEIDNVLYQDQIVSGEWRPSFAMPLPANDVINFQIQVESPANPQLWCMIGTSVIYTVNPTTIDSNYVWSLTLSEYPNLVDKCVQFLIVDLNQYDATNGVEQAILLESEPIGINSYNESLIKISYINNESYDTITFDDNYIGYFYLPATLIQEPNTEESTVYMQSNGQNVKLTSRQFSSYSLKTDYITRYMHEIFALVLSLDSINFNATLMVAKDAYSYSNIERFALSQGETKLTRALYNKLNTNC